MNGCSIRSCTNRIQTAKNKLIKYFPFPEDPNVAKQWLKACASDDINPKNARLCPIHFSADSFQDALPRKQPVLGLKDTAVPTKYLTIDEDNIRCRTCLTTEKNKIYTKVSGKCTEDLTIQGAILWIIPKLKVDIKEDDHVCSDCVEILKNMVKFVLNCLKADALLYQIENTAQLKDTLDNEQDVAQVDQIKVEPEEDKVTSDEISNETQESETNYQDDDINKELRFWNKCCKLLYGRKRGIENVKKFDDLTLGQHDKVVSLGPLKYHYLQKFTKDVKTAIQPVKYSTFKGDKQRILLIGSQAYQKCPVCEQEFVTESLLNDHFDQCHKDISKTYLIKTYETVPLPNHLRCDRCDKNFKTFINLQKHAKKCILLNCPYCNVLFKRSVLNLHIKTEHSRPYPFDCFICKQQFHYYRSFKQHDCDIISIENGEIKTKTAEQQKKKKVAAITHRKCQYCKEIVPTGVYTNHIKMNHRNYACSLCSRRFLWKHSLEAHELTHVKKLCVHCGKLISKKYFDIHVESHRTDGPKEESMECPNCKKLFFSEKTLKAHLKRAHRPRVMCELCGLNIRSNHLKSHYITIHSGIKNFVCDVCSQQFSRKDYLDKHVVIHGVENHYSRKFGFVRRKRNSYIINPNDPITCKFCLKTFRNVHILKNHVENHIKLCRYKCRYCDLTYSNRQNRLKHEKQHDNPNYSQFRCNTCWKVFSNQEEVDFHESTTHSRKFQCEYCERSFSREFAYITHLVQIHYEPESLIKETEEIIAETLSPYKLKRETMDD